MDVVLKKNKDKIKDKNSKDYYFIWLFNFSINVKYYLCWWNKWLNEKFFFLRMVGNFDV